MTPNVITFLVTNMMLQERLFRVKPDRKHYDRVCGIILLLIDKREVTLNMMKTTGEGGGIQESGNIPEVTVNHSDLPSSSSASSYLLTSTSFSQSCHIYKRFHLVHLSVRYVQILYSMHNIIYREVEHLWKTKVQAL